SFAHLVRTLKSEALSRRRIFDTPPITKTMKTSIRLIALAIGVLLLAVQSSLAQPAFVLDPAFHPTITAPGGQISSGLPQPDGKLIVSGDFQAINGVARNDVARLNSDGSVDESFDPGAVRFYANPSVVQPDGKLVAAGSYVRDDTEFSGLFRLDTNGHPDPMFVVSPDFG